MKTISKHVPAGELPVEWREEGGFAPDDRVTVTIEAEHPSLTALRERIERAITQSERGESRELTDDDFEAIKQRGRERRLSRTG